MERTYIAIDLKSFYASVECARRGFDALHTNLVVADASRTEKTICLAVSPPLKAYGIPGRARLFEVIEQVAEINAQRLRKAPGHRFSGKSSDDCKLNADPSLELDFVIAPPRMADYMKISTGIYRIYLNYFAASDIHVYSIDEVMIDATGYLDTYHMDARTLTQVILKEVLEQTGITATAGIGTNLFLCKVAMDVVAKHSPADENGVRIAELDEMSYRRLLWDHRPITDIWRVGHGYARRLESVGLYTMGDVARCSIGKADEFHNEALLYKLFGVNAELLIDHAWGWEPCTMEAVKAYRPETKSLSSGQVLAQPYSAEKGRMVLREMTELLALDLVDKGLLTDQLVLTVGYDIDNLKQGAAYHGDVTVDYYGRRVPRHAHGTANLGCRTSSTRKLLDAVLPLYDRIVDSALLVRRFNISANHLHPAAEEEPAQGEQLDLFTDPQLQEQQRQEDAREQRMQQAMLKIQKKYGKNAILKGTNFEEGATTIQRNQQIGGHKA